MQREKRTILVVDSSATFIFYVAMMLRKLQYVVQTASTAEDALKMIAGSAPAVVSLKLLIRARELAVTARVLYSSAKVGGPHAVPGMGVSFETIDPEDRTFIREFIREQVTNALATKPRQ